MTALWRKLRPAALAIGAVVYIALGYLASSSDHPPLLAVVLGALPLLAGMLLACWHSPFRLPATALCLGLIAALALNLPVLLRHASWLYFIQHAGTMSALGIMFGATLGSHENALCSILARQMIAEPLDANYLRYTWRVTLAWTLYFFCSALLSAGLFFGASLPAWAFFAAVLTPLSLGVMFGGEFLIRLYALPGRPHFSIAQTIQSYQAFMQGKKKTGIAPLHSRSVRCDEPDTPAARD